MTSVAVVADSASDLAPGVAAAAGIRVVPLTVTFGDTSFLDGTELPAEAFWERMQHAEVFPTTASPSPERVLGVYRSAADAGATAVVSVHLAAALSRTVESARHAASRSPIPVEVIDSGSVSGGQGLVALAAARAAAAGASAGAVAEAAREASARLHVVAAIETVDYLRRGGRLGRARAALSDLLRIRPVLSIENGEPVLVARTRTRTRALEELLRRLPERAEAAAVFHSGAPEAEDVAGRLAATWALQPAMGLIGAVTGSHLGPRALGVALLVRR